MLTPFSLLSHVFGVMDLKLGHFCLGNLAYGFMLGGHVFIGFSLQSVSSSHFSAQML